MYFGAVLRNVEFFLTAERRHFASEHEKHRNRKVRNIYRKQFSCGTLQASIDERIDRKKARLMAYFFSMDPTGIEPVSENPLIQLSPRTVCY